MKKYSWGNSSCSVHRRFMFYGYSDILTGRGDEDPVSRRSWKVNEMNKLNTIVPVTLLLLLVIGAIGVMVFWGLSLLDPSE